ncbi:MAG: PilZ domain-containing protein [Hyphomicrobiaceae bacterium]|jgi:hypothetical protein
MDQPSTIAERRRSARRRQLKASTIVLQNLQSTYKCVTRNVSPDGAGLEFVGSMPELPPAFTLVIDSDEIEQDCLLVWLTGQRAGVAFTGPPRSSVRRRRKAASAPTEW